jgi:hypothetical protein
LGQVDFLKLLIPPNKKPNNEFRKNEKEEYLKQKMFLKVTWLVILMKYNIEQYKVTKELCIGIYSIGKLMIVYYYNRNN